MSGDEDVAAGIDRDGLAAITVEIAKCFCPLECACSGAVTGDENIVAGGSSERPAAEINRTAIVAGDERIAGERIGRDGKGLFGISGPKSFPPHGSSGG